MWILPSRFSRCVLEEGASTLPFDSALETLSSSVLLKSKVTQLRYWRRALTTATWISRLCGRIYEPSMAAHGVERWIALLAATRASLSRSQERDSEPPTPATSGRTSPESLERSSPSSASSRMSLGTYETDFERFGMTFEEWVTQLRRACLQRRKSGHRTSARGSTFWQTPANPASRWPSGPNWPTPNAMDGLRAGKADDPVAWLAHRAKHAAKGVNAHFPLNIAAKLWATPRTTDTNTPSWSPARERIQLREEAVRFDFSASGPRIETTPPAGPSGSPTERKLNPGFTETLMGWPTGWSACTSSETGWSRWLQQMRYAYSYLLEGGPLSEG